MVQHGARELLFHYFADTSGLPTLETVVTILVPVYCGTNKQDTMELLEPTVPTAQSNTPFSEHENGSNWFVFVNSVVTSEIIRTPHLDWLLEARMVFYQTHEGRHS